MSAVLIGCVTTDTRLQLREGMSKSQLDDITNWTTTINDDPFVSPVSDFNRQDKMEILYAEGRKYFYVFTEVTERTTNSNVGNGRFHSVYTSLVTAERAVERILLAKKSPAKISKSVPIQKSYKASQGIKKSKKFEAL